MDVIRQMTLHMLISMQHWALVLFSSTKTMMKCHIAAPLRESLPRCHCWGSTGPNGPFHQQTQTALDGLVTTPHHRHSLHCPQRSTVACYAVRANGIGFHISFVCILASQALTSCVLNRQHCSDPTLLVQSLTVQSNEEVMKRWEKSMGPTALWQLMPVTGPWCPSNISPMPALLKWTKKARYFLKTNNIYRNTICAFYVSATVLCNYGMSLRLWSVLWLSTKYRNWVVAGCWHTVKHCNTTLV